MNGYDDDDDDDKYKIKRLKKSRLVRVLKRSSRLGKAWGGLFVIRY